MTVGTARGAATDWVMRHGSRLEDFRGTYLIGSTVGLADDAELPTGSDVDVMVVGAAAPAGGRLPPFRREALGSLRVRSCWWRRSATLRCGCVTWRPAGYWPSAVTSTCTPRLLGLLGCAGWDRELAGRHLEALADTFDTAAAVARTPFFLQLRHHPRRTADRHRCRQGADPSWSAL
jgi:hypothetical protein